MNVYIFFLVLCLKGIILTSAGKLGRNEDLRFISEGSGLESEKANGSGSGEEALDEPEYPFAAAADPQSGLTTQVLQSVASKPPPQGVVPFSSVNSMPSASIQAGQSSLVVESSASALVPSAGLPSSQPLPASAPLVSAKSLPTKAAGSLPLPSVQAALQLSLSVQQPALPVQSSSQLALSSKATQPVQPSFSALVMKPSNVLPPVSKPSAIASSINPATQTVAIVVNPSDSVIPAVNLPTPVIDLNSSTPAVSQPQPSASASPNMTAPSAIKPSVPPTQVASEVFTAIAVGQSSFNHQGHPRKSFKGKLKTNIKNLIENSHDATLARTEKTAIDQESNEDLLNGEGSTNIIDITQENGSGEEMLPTSEEQQTATALAKDTKQDRDTSVEQSEKDPEKMINNTAEKSLEKYYEQQQSHLKPDNSIAKTIEDQSHTQKQTPGEDNVKSEQTAPQQTFQTPFVKVTVDSSIVPKVETHDTKQDQASETGYEKDTELPKETAEVIVREINQTPNKTIEKSPETIIEVKIGFTGDNQSQNAEEEEEEDEDEIEMIEDQRKRQRRKRKHRKHNRSHRNKKHRAHHKKHHKYRQNKKSKDDEEENRDSQVDLEGPATDDVLAFSSEQQITEEEAAEGIEIIDDHQKRKHRRHSRRHRRKHSKHRKHRRHHKKHQKKHHKIRQNKKSKDDEEEDRDSQVDLEGSATDDVLALSPEQQISEEEASEGIEIIDDHQKRKNRRHSRRHRRKNRKHRKHRKQRKHRKHRKHRRYHKIKQGKKSEDDQEFNSNSQAAQRSQVSNSYQSLSPEQKITEETAGEETQIIYDPLRNVYKDRKHNRSHRRKHKKHRKHRHRHAQQKHKKHHKSRQRNKGQNRDLQVESQASDDIPSVLSKDEEEAAEIIEDQHKRKHRKHHRRHRKHRRRHGQRKHKKHRRRHGQRKHKKHRHIKRKKSGDAYDQEVFDHDSQVPIDNAASQ